MGTWGWLLVDLLIVGLALLALGLGGLRLYRRVRALLRAAGTAGDRLSAVAPGRPPDVHV